MITPIKALSIRELETARRELKRSINKAWDLRGSFGHPVDHLFLKRIEDELTRRWQRVLKLIGA